MNILTLNSMKTNIGRYEILHDVSFDVEEGGTFVLLGRNGAGKTTTLRSIMGLWKPSLGSAKFLSTDITKMHTSDIARLGIAYVPENMGIFGVLTVEENMMLATSTGKFNKNYLERVYSLFPDLKTLWKKHACSLSGGQKQMLAIARAIIDQRRLILVDEPTKGLAPAIIDAMSDAFRDIAKTTTILLVEENFQFASLLGRSMAVIEDGHIIHKGSMQEFAANVQLQNKLLGITA